MGITGASGHIRIHLPQPADPAERPRGRPIILSAAAVAGCSEEAGADADGARQLASVDPDPSSHLYPVKRNPAYAEGGPDRPMTDPDLATSYNNFYEFGGHKNISRAAQALKIRPWTVTLDGEVSQPKTIDIDALLGQMPLEERVYRHRCVEAWSMVVPWSGFPLSALVKLAEPLSSAKYIRMETFMDPDSAKGQKQHWYPWPYIEGLTIDEAMNDLAFIATGLYGKPIPARTAPRCGWRYRGNTASNRPNPLSASRSLRNVRFRSGKRCNPASTASGRM